MSTETRFKFFLFSVIALMLAPWKQGTWPGPGSSTYLLMFKHLTTVYPKKYAHGFVVLCFVAVMQSFIMNSHEVFIHIHQGCFAGTGAIVRLPQCQWSKPDGYGKISQCITTTKHSKAKTVCIFLGIYCMLNHQQTHHLVYIIADQTILSKVGDEISRYHYVLNGDHCGYLLEASIFSCLNCYNLKRIQHRRGNICTYMFKAIFQCSYNSIPVKAIILNTYKCL